MMIYGVGDVNRPRHLDTVTIVEAGSTTPTDNVPPERRGDDEANDSLVCYDRIISQLLRYIWEREGMLLSLGIM